MGSPDVAPCLYLVGFTGERSGPVVVVAADDSGAAFDLSSTKRAGRAALLPTVSPLITTTAPATRLGSRRAFTVADYRCSRPRPVGAWRHERFRRRSISSEDLGREGKKRETGERGK
jgi:hypothetical protein